MKRLIRKVNWLHIIILIVVGSALIAGLYLSRDAYMGIIVPESVDPCSPDATRAVRLSQDSKWPVERSLEQRCPPASEADDPDEE